VSFDVKRQLNAVESKLNRTVATAAYKRGFGCFNQSLSQSFNQASNFFYSGLSGNRVNRHCKDHREVMGKSKEGKRKQVKYKDAV